MHPVQKHLFDTNFRDLSGTNIEGTIAISDELINLGILDFLQQLQKPAAAGDSETRTSTVKASPAPNPADLLKILTIDKLQYRTEAGRTLLEIKAGIV